MKWESHPHQTFIQVFPNQDPLSLSLFLSHFLHLSPVALPNTPRPTTTIFLVLGCRKKRNFPSCSMLCEKTANHLQARKWAMGLPAP